MSPIDDPLYDTDGAAEFLGSLNLPTSRHDLVRKRVKKIGGGPAFVRWRAKHVRYSRQALLDWAASQLHPCNAA
jgi:hypothetical protein